MTGYSFLERCKSLVVRFSRREYHADKVSHFEPLENCEFHSANLVSQAGCSLGEGVCHGPAGLYRNVPFHPRPTGTMQPTMLISSPHSLV